MKNTGSKRFLGIFVFLAVFAGASAIVMLLWNWLIPSLIGWGSLGYWQAAGLLLLCKLLFGGFGKGGHGAFMAHGFHRKFHGNERAEMRERIKNMSEEERREYIRDHMFGSGRPGWDNDCR